MNRRAFVQSLSVAGLAAASLPGLAEENRAGPRQVIFLLGESVRADMSSPSTVVID